MATEFGKRLYLARKHAGLTQVQAAKRMGIPQSTISTNERLAYGSRDTVMYAITYGVDGRWLATGEGQMVPDGSTDSEKSGNLSVSPVATRLVPLLTTKTAGMFKDFIDRQDYGESVPCAEPGSSYTFALRVEGDSMEPEFSPGTVVIVDPDVEHQQNDFVVVRLANGDASLKQLTSDDGEWYLKPANSRYPIKPMGDAQVIGVVVGSFKSYKRG